MQKYVERPLLVYETKFDIRQWFVVTSWSPLVIWMTKTCYLRFCSQLYHLDSYHESIHLCNNAIQCRYTNENSRSRHLPDENMWTSEKFIDFLSERNLSHMWEERVYPGMKSAILHSMRASKSRMSNVKFRHEAFELFGADFILSQDFNPWLIEINASPAIGPTTSVMAHLVPKLLRDLVAVSTASFGNVVNNNQRVNNNNNSAYAGKMTPSGFMECIAAPMESELRKKSAKQATPSTTPVKTATPATVDYIDKVMSTPSHERDGSTSRVGMLKKWMSKSAKNLSAAVETYTEPPEVKVMTRKKKKSLQERSKTDKEIVLRRRRNNNRAELEHETLLRELQSSTRRRSQFLHSAPTLTSEANEAIASLSGTNTREAAVRNIIKQIPVMKDERLFAKYGCNHCIAN